MASIPDRIFCLLKERGIEQKEFAQKIGASGKTVSAWKTGRAKSYTKYLAKIAEALSVPVEYLVKEWDETEFSCRLQAETIQVNELTAQIVQVIINSSCTYQIANKALTQAQQVLLEQTRPVIEPEQAKLRGETKCKG